MEKDTDKKILLNSITVALLFSANSLTWMLGIDNAIVMVMAFIVGLYVLLGNRLLPRHVLPLTLYLCCFFLFSFLFKDNNEPLRQYFLEFIMMGVVALLFSQVIINVDTVILALCFISIPVAPFILRIDFLGDTNYGQWMGVSYGSIKFIVALLYALLLIQTKKILKVLFVFPLVFYVVFFLSFGSRGAIVGVFTFVLLAFLIKRGTSLTTNVIVIVSLILMTIVLFLPLINLLADVFGKLGVDFYAIDKILAFFESGRDIDNGRSDRLVDGFNMFLSSPLFGNGVAAFENKYKIGYVHNLFVQQLLEGGLFLFLPLTVFLCTAFRIVLSNRYDLNIRLYLAFLISCNIIELLFSNYYWRVQGYWYLIGFVMPFTFKRLKNNHIIVKHNIV